MLRGLARDGYVVELDEDTDATRLRAVLPEEIALLETDDEVRRLLRQHGFQVPAGHLDQAIEAHTRGDWAAANAQLRTFFESLLDAIALAVDAAAASTCASSENRRAMLANKGFLVGDRNEWTPDGKNFINGLFKMLHADGSHPGLSDEDRRDDQPSPRAISFAAKPADPPLSGGMSERRQRRRRITVRETPQSEQTFGFRSRPFVPVSSRVF